MEMSFLNELGATVGEFLYRDRELVFNSSVFPKSLKPEYIIADFQLCFYNPLALKQALKECGLVFESSNNARRVYKGKDLIIEIEKSGRAVKLTNHLRGYSYVLEGDFE